MKTVECDWCINFIPMVFKDEHNYFSGILFNAKCKLGKRIMFRNPKPRRSFMPYYLGGYIRKCGEFKSKNL